MDSRSVALYGTNEGTIKEVAHNFVLGQSEAEARRECVSQKTKSMNKEVVSIVSRRGEEGPESESTKVSVVQQVVSLGAGGDTMSVNRDVRVALLQDSIVKQHAAIRRSGVPNFKGCRFPVNSGINLSFLEEKLSDYGDKQVIELLRFGFPVNYEGQGPGEIMSVNHKGARQFSAEVDKYIDKESQLGAIIGPFARNPLNCDLKLNPLNTTPKRDSDERRVIVDLSFPRNASVNSGIDRHTYLGEPVRLKYPSVDSLVELVKMKGRGCALYKRDLKRAYRQIPVDPGDIHLLGFKWKNSVYLDLFLPMGLRSAALCCQRVSDAVSFICQSQGFQVINYLDDFGGAEKWDRADEAYHRLGDILRDCGLIESAEKACPPSCIMTFLGVQFNTLDLSLTITPDRLAEVSELLEKWMGKENATKQELQVLLGKLHFVANCVRPGRVFVSRLLNCLRAFPETGKVRLSDEVRKDVNWWLRFMPTYNGVSMMPWQQWSEPDSVLSTDACLTGCGAWVADEYFHCQFPSRVQASGRHINELEMLTIVVALKVWGDRFRGQRLQIFCDNETTVSILNSGASRNEFLQSCLREAVFVAATYEFEIRARHLAGHLNRISDLLSRWHLGPQFQQEFSQLNGQWGLKEVQANNELFELTSDW